MKTVRGEYNTAKIFTNVIDEKALWQIQAMCDSVVFAGECIRVMPDVHAGARCTVGTTLTITDKVVPNMVGVDIGCGMELVQLAEKSIDLEALDKLIYASIPSGRECRSSRHALASEIDLSELCCFDSIRSQLAYKSIGSLGGGNHFIEVDKDEDGGLYLVVHSGSRHLGLEVAEYYQNKGYERLCGKARDERNAHIEKLKAAGRVKEINKLLKNERASEVERDNAHVEGKQFKNYIHDMKIVQRFAVLNRQAMVREIVEGLGLTVKDSFTTIHNYIDTDHMILRKGAVSARKAERLLIPINMRDGSLICVGKGNDDWNQSAPHGAGRLLSRSQARARLNMNEFKKEMTGIYSTSISANTLDESPMAYKKIDDIIDNIKPTVKIERRILPIYNFKASDGMPYGRKS